MQPGVMRSNAAEPDPAVASALRTVAFERAGLDALAGVLGNGLGEVFSQVIARIRAAKGRVVISGMGKSGHVGRKIASTFASTGTPATFVHPSEASHGDLGMITADDLVLALSWSGETRELSDIVNYTRRFGVALIAITSAPHSTLARSADICLTLPVIEEACPHGLAPTTSALLQMAIGDALAVALLEARGFSATDFRDLHPGGKLGASLTFVRTVMHANEAVPLVPEGTRMSDAVVVMTRQGFGCVGVTDAAGRLIGIVTDGDLRRHMAPDLMTRLIDAVMTRRPKTARPDSLASDALRLMETAPRVTALFVVEGDRPIGIVHMHDLLRIGLV